MIKLNSHFIKLPSKKILMNNIIHNRGKTLTIHKLYYPMPSKLTNTQRSFNQKMLPEIKSLPEVENFYNDNGVYYLINSPNIYKFNSSTDNSQTTVNSSISGKYSWIDKTNKKIHIYDNVNKIYYIYNIAGNDLQTINLDVDSTTSLMPTGQFNIIIKNVHDTTTATYTYSIVDNTLAQTSANTVSLSDNINVYPTINKNGNVIFLDETSVQEYDSNLNLINKYDFTTNIIDATSTEIYVKHLYENIYAIFEKAANTLTLKIVDVETSTIKYNPADKYYNIDVIYDTNVNNNINILASYSDSNTSNYIIKYIQLNSNDFSTVIEKTILESSSNYVDLIFAYDDEDVLINHSTESVLYYQNDLLFTLNYDVNFIYNKNDLLFSDIYTPVITDITANVSTDSTILIDFKFIGDAVYADNTISKTYEVSPPGDTIVLPIKVYYPGNIKVNYVIKILT